MADGFGGYSPYTGAGNLASAMGANPSFGGYTGGAGAYGYQYPYNTSAYNPWVAQQAQFKAPTFTNSMSNWLGASGGLTPAQMRAMGISDGAASVANSVYGGGGGSDYANVASPFASQMMGQGDPSGGASSGGYTEAQIRAGYGGGESPFGEGWSSAASPTTGSTWDPQNTAYNMVNNNQISPALGLNNMARYANAFNNMGFGNPNAGQAMGSVTGGESGGNPFAVNPSSGAFGMNQWLGSRATNASNLLGYSPAQIRAGYGGGYTSPEMQAAVAGSEITGGGYPGVYSTLNNPNSSLSQMQGAGLNQFEAPALSDRPAEMGRIVNYGNQLTPSALGNAAASVAQPPYTPPPSQGQGRY